MPWTAEVISGSNWLSIVAGTSGTHGETITCAFTSNEIFPTSRSGMIRVIAEGAPDSPVDVTVTQSGNPPVLSVTPSRRDIAVEAGSTTFNVSKFTGIGPMPWTAEVTTSNSWLSISSGASGTDSGTIKCKFTTNTGTSTRYGTIRITAAGATGSPMNVTVKQAFYTDVKGDVNGDGDLNLADTIFALQISANIDPAGNVHYEADVNSNDKIGIEEAIFSLEHLARILRPAPTATAASRITSTTFQANWDSVSWATGYCLDVSTSSGFGSFVCEYNDKDVGNTTVQIISDLKSGTQYYYRVRAYNAKGTSCKSNVVNVTPGGSGYIPDFTNSLGMDFVYIDPGIFMMGSPEDEPCRGSDETLHQVILTQGFYIQTTEVTQGQWKAVMGSNPSTSFQNFGDDCPVEQVSWNDVQAFITALNAIGGRTYRLPTEAEWEYAARAGTSTAFASGEFTNPNGDCEIGPNLDSIGWYYNNSGWSIRPVAQKQANAWGLYDMHGNVYEWCHDWYSDYPSESVTDPEGPSFGDYRVMRGGCYVCDAWYCRSASRSRFKPGRTSEITGFRLVSPQVSSAPYAPAAITASYVTSTGFQANWNIVSGATGYRLDVSTGSGFSSFVPGYNNRDVGSVTSKTISGLSSNTPYYYRVRAYNAGGTSRNSNVRSVTTTGGGGSNVTNSLGMDFVYIEPGTFMMGSPEDELGRDSRETRHEVTLTRGYYMQTTEVTQGQWEAVMGSNPSYFSNCGDNCPVEMVSWNDVQAFITALNAMGIGTYRLPTEAEWEYSCRAGTATAFANGGITKPDYECGHDPNLNAMGWHCGNSDSKTHPVAQKQANAWGLYDMHGNVWEWCQDWYGNYPSDSIVDPEGPSFGDLRVRRGGCWRHYARSCRSAYRSSGSPDGRDYVLGFRLVASQVSQ